MEFFKIDEFKCSCCGEAKMDKVFLEKLDGFRKIFGKPLKVTSGYRCLVHNASIGGKDKSQHLFGKAADISLAPFSSSEKHALLALAFSMFDGVGVASGFVHVDIRDRKSTWTY